MHPMPHGWRRFRWSGRTTMAPPGTVMNTIQSAPPAADRWEVTIADLPAPAIIDRNGCKRAGCGRNWTSRYRVEDLRCKHTCNPSFRSVSCYIAGQTPVDLSRPFAPFSQSGIGAAFSICG